MGKHFRIIKGGRQSLKGEFRERSFGATPSGYPKKDGLDEPKRVAMSRNDASPAYANPFPTSSSVPAESRGYRTGRSAGISWPHFGDIDASFIGLIVTSFLAVFIGVWQFSAPVPQMGLLNAAGSTDNESASFGFCHIGGGTNCVVDGDTFWHEGINIRIADIDTPETHPPGCASEAKLGAAATQRLQALLNAGSFSLESINRDTDTYGRQLRIVTRGGNSLGGILVDEGLARWYEGGRQPWC